MASRTPLRSPLSLLAMAALMALAWGLGTRSSRREEPALPLPEECRGLSPAECRALLDTQERPAPGETGATFLEADEACRDVGYLCAGLEAAGNLRVVHWPIETTVIRVLVPEPMGLSSGQARALQDAAVRGIRAWQGHPIPIQVRTRDSGEDPDITVEWTRTVDDGRLGRADLEWVIRPGGVEVRVSGFVIATHPPGDEGRLLSPLQVELVAAHEMGHALGLPHSDDSRDLMFPTNTATRLTARDFRTVAALYELPAGIEIRR